MVSPFVFAIVPFLCEPIDSVMLCNMRSLFHFAFNVTDLDEARRFYGDVLGCTEGRSTDTWVDFDFYDHQISLHLGEPW